MQQISKKRKLVKDGVFYAEINEFLRRYLAEDGYAGVEIKPKPESTQVVIKCTKTADVVKKIPEIQKLLQLRFGLPVEGIRVFAERVQPRGLSARAQAQSICYKLKNGVAVRRACYGVLKYIMDNGQAKGVQIIISGKLRGARAKAMKFKEGFMISSGNATNEYIVEAVEHVLLRSGTIGVRVKIMLPRETHPDRVSFLPRNDLPDVVNVRDPKLFDYDAYDRDFEAPSQQPVYEQEQQFEQQPPQQQFEQAYEQPQQPVYEEQQQYQQENYVTPQ